MDLTRVLTGPFCSMILGDMGAEVIKVEEPGKGDDTRSWPPFVAGEATYFLSVNRNKKSVTLNLKSSEGRSILKGLLARADVLLENFRPGTIAKLGLGYETTRRLNRRLIYSSISGFGQTGPEAGRAGYDLITQSESGLMDLTGFPDGPPVKVGTSIADLAAGLAAAQAVVTALYSREKTGRGQRLEVSMLDVLVSFLTYQAGIYFATGQCPTRRGNEHPSIVPYEVFKGADAYFTVGVANNGLWERFCGAIGHPEIRHDPRFESETERVTNRASLVPILNAIFAERPAWEWIDALTRAGVPAGHIRNVAEVCESQHVKARGMIFSLKHPKVGTVRALGSPVRFGGGRFGPAATAPPLLGEHTDEVLTRLLGMDRRRIARLRATGVV